MEHKNNLFHVCGLSITLLSMLVFYSPNAFGQTNAESSKTLTIRSGTHVSLSLKDDVTTKNKQLVEKSPISFYVTYDVIVENEVVIPAGTIVIGEVTNLVKPRIFGKPGSITIKIDKIQAVDNTLLLVGGNNVINKVGTKSGISSFCITTGVVLEVVGLLVYAPACIVGLPFFIPPFIVKGGDAVVPSGAQYEVTIINNSKIEIKTTNK